MATQTKKQSSSRRPRAHQPQYGWKSIGELKCGDIIVILQQEMVVQDVRQQDGSWWLSYTRPEAKSTSEEFYGVNAYVYVRVSQ